MNGSATQLTEFLKNTSTRFFVPVYQRPYSWKEQQCQQLFNDLESLLRENRATHFFGSIVLKGEACAPNTNYQVIDGQQRLTTVLLLLLTIRNLLLNTTTSSDDGQLSNQSITNDYLINNQAHHQEDRARLHLCGKDAQTWKFLLGFSGSPAKDSQLIRNQRFFEDCLRRSVYPLARIYEAIQKLVVICITIGPEDDPQLIFESINATGLALTEGDKVRNFLLMDFSPTEQEHLHACYWTEIEHHTKGEVSELLRDFLSVKRQSTPRIDAIYTTFKQYTGGCGLERETILQELKRYAEWFGLLRDGGANDWLPALQGSLRRLKHLDVAALRPFALEVLRHHAEGDLSQNDLLAIFTIVECFLIRRAICEVPTAALNKIFPTLDNDIARITHGNARYVDVLTYILLAKSGSHRFPNDAEFRADLASRQVYKMSKPYKNYLFERLENGGYKGTDSLDQIPNQANYTIEHILPQKPSQAWHDALGPQYEKIYDSWLHRLANLTLTDYNSELSNATFIEKRDAFPKGFRRSQLRLNHYLAQFECWDETTLQEREKALCDRALALWPFPKTDFRPLERQWDTFSLADEDASPTNRKPARYRFHGDPIPAKDWATVFLGVMRTLLDKHRATLHALADANGNNGFAWLASTPDGFRTPEKLDEKLFLEQHGSADQRLRNLRNLFSRLGEDPEDLVFYLQKNVHTKEDTNAFEQDCYAYWTFALPTLKTQCSWLNKRNPTFNSHLMTRRPGFRGHELHYIVTASSARISMNLWFATAEENKIAFDRLVAHRQAIETAFGAPIVWDRNNKGRGSWFSYSLPGVNVHRQEDWPTILAFHEKWGLRLWKAVEPFLQS